MKTGNLNKESVIMAWNPRKNSWTMSSTSAASSKEEMKPSRLTFKATSASIKRNISMLLSCCFPGTRTWKSAKEPLNKTETTVPKSEEELPVRGSTELFRRERVRETIWKNSPLRLDKDTQTGSISLTPGPLKNSLAYWLSTPASCQQCEESLPNLLLRHSCQIEDGRTICRSCYLENRLNDRFIGIMKKWETLESLISQIITEAITDDSDMSSPEDDTRIYSTPTTTSRSYSSTGPVTPKIASRTKSWKRSKMDIS